MTAHTTPSYSDTRRAVQDAVITAMVKHSAPDIIDGDLRDAIVGEVINELVKILPSVEITESLDTPTTCKVFFGRTLMFDGVDRSVLLRIARAGE